MPTILETPSRRIRFQEMDPDSYVDVDSSGVETNGGDKVGMAQYFDLKEDPSFWKDNNVQVAIRIRPLSSSEISLQGKNLCVRQDSCQSITWMGHPESRFTFDHVAGEQITQEQLFKVAGVPVVDNCVAGYNSCMFAYGQTGSGKTHTMLGDIEGGTRRHSVNAGMTPRVFEYLFSRIQKEREARRDEKLRFICKCSFLEIYNEQILDLLDPSSKNLQIREDARKGIHVDNLTEFEVSSARDVIQELVQGAANRKVASTNMNRASSRSHSVFTCTIESKWDSQGVTHYRFARLNLVDLAGSERQKSSGAEGERLKEATNINKSLSTLGLVIMNLVSISNKKSLHVPYRDSKLTFLLQDSLGGNSKTIIIANISPSNCCALETLSTLKFAQRAKFIRNNAVINEDASGDVITMRLQIQQLKKEVHRLQALANGGCENQEADNMGFAILQTPGSFKWDGGQGSFTPLMVDKKISQLQRKECEAALVAAIRRDQDKDKSLKALTSEKQAAEQLASQRSDEVQALKMRLRFREERIKRLEAVSSGKLSAEMHLLKEKDELLKELDVLCSQVDRNREATRFAMENLQLKEELRRLQSFVEEGERDMMNEQIAVLQDKLLEALDWKLMHEKETTDTVQRSLDFAPSHEEMEFFRHQAIQNQREVDALRKNLSSCLEAKEKLERRVDELVLQLEVKMKGMKNLNGPIATEDTSQPLDLFADVSSDQFDLKVMVEAIGNASQREAEAHETAITLVKENEALRAKLNVLIEDNNKLIELCDNLAEGGANSNNAVAMQTQNSGIPEGASVIAAHDSEETSEAENVKHQPHEFHEHEKLTGLYEEGIERDFKAKNVEQLVHRLQEMHEENDKLMGLYEQAMQDRDVKTKNAEQLEYQLREMREENDKMMGLYEHAMQERDVKTKNAEQLECQLQEACEENDKMRGLYEQAMQERDAKTKNAEQLEYQLREIRDELNKVMGLYEHAMQERNVKIENAEKLGHQLLEMHQENGKMTSLYEQAMQEREAKTENAEQLGHQLREMHGENEKLMGLYELAMQERDVKMMDVEKLELQLQKMHEENGKVIGLYEQAMQERDAKTRSSKELELQLQEIHQESEKLRGLYEQAIQERDEFKGMLCSTDLHIPKVREESSCPEKLVEVDEGLVHYNKKESKDPEPKTDSIKLADHLCLVQEKLGFVQEKFHTTIRLTDVFSLLDNQTKEFLILADKLQAVYQNIHSKQEEIAFLKSSLSTIQDRRRDMKTKFSALRAFFMKITSIEGVELQAQARVDVGSILVERKKEELSNTVAKKEEVDAACSKATKLEARLKEDYTSLRLKYQQAESQKRGTEKVLFAIDNLQEKDTPSHKILQLGKACELLKSEEERTMLITEIKQARGKIVLLQKEISSFKKDTEALDANILDLDSEVKSGLIFLDESRVSLEHIVRNKEAFLERVHSPWSDMGKFLLDFQDTMFKSELKGAEICIRTEELQLEVDKLEMLKASRSFMLESYDNIHKGSGCTNTNPTFVEEMVKGQLQDVCRVVEEAKSLLSSVII